MKMSNQIVSTAMIYIIIVGLLNYDLGMEPLGMWFNLNIPVGLMLGVGSVAALSNWQSLLPLVATMVLLNTAREITIEYIGYPDASLLWTTNILFVLVAPALIFGCWLIITRSTLGTKVNSMLSSNMVAIMLSILVAVVIILNLTPVLAYNNEMFGIWGLSLMLFTAIVAAAYVVVGGIRNLIWRLNGQHLGLI